jgi:hypothetical protein
VVVIPKHLATSGAFVLGSDIAAIVIVKVDLSIFDVYLFSPPILLSS